jgi:hypothetical protein
VDDHLGMKAKSEWQQETSQAFQAAAAISIFFQTKQKK